MDTLDRMPVVLLRLVSSGSMVNMLSANTVSAVHYHSPISIVLQDK